MDLRADVIVVGAGVVGLTTAVRLLERGLEVVIVADRRHPNTTSDVAAGLWYPYKAGGRRIATWALESLAAYRSLIPIAGAGVRFVPCRSYVPADEPTPFWAEVDVEYRERPVRHPVNGSPTRMLEAVLPVVQSAVFIPWLEDRVMSLGGSIFLLDRSLVEVSELDARVIVNCSGLGARKLCGDESVVPVRGAVVRMSGTGIDECITDDIDPDHPTYIIPSSGFCVLGGSAEADRWDMPVSQEEAQDIVDRCARLDSRVRSGTVVGVAAGLRPWRPEVRLELEHTDSGRPVVHNYGHGGSGYTLAWGCADEAAELVAAAFG
ncbi:MAG TPA: FAD-dependent oxidoreductase [Rhodothermales bacterium]|nr:FAD-dependent oxidoreductase [Rhodothermales bacterium]